MFIKQGENNLIGVSMRKPC